MSIRKTMFITITVMVLIPSLIFSGVLMSIYSKQTKTVIAESMQSVANAQIAEMERFCMEQREAFLLIGNMETAMELLRNEDGKGKAYIDDMLATRVSMQEYIYTATLVGADGRILACSEENYEKQAKSELNNIIEAMGDLDFYISSTMNSKVNGEDRKVVVAISAIKDKDETLGYVLMEVDTEFYSGIREQNKTWEDSTFYLVDGKGKIISAGTAESERKDFVTSKEDREDYNAKFSAIDWEKNPEGSFTYEILGTNYITYYSTIDYTKWKLMLTVNLDDYQSTRPVYIALAMFLIILAAALSIWIGNFTSKRIMKPIRRISEAINHIRDEQDYTKRIEIEHADELGVLAYEVNGLLDFIEEENLYKAKKARELQSKAESDALTKVMNKGKIESYLEEAIERCRIEKKPLAVMFTDVDDFKSFNSLYGHSVGDQVLKFFASLLVRTIDGNIGRMGGDEFLAVIEGKSIGSIEESLQVIQDYAKRNFILRGGGQIKIGCSMGVILVDFERCSYEDVTGIKLIDAADALMYKVKNNGKEGYGIEKFCDELGKNL